MTHSHTSFSALAAPSSDAQIATEAPATPDFQRYQQQFTRYLRDPRNNKPPQGANRARMRVYAEVVFNSVFGSVSACYPVCQKMLGKRKWHQLVRAFFKEYSADTPIFREIPAEFLAYLQQLSDLPPYLTALAHYEWMELAVSSLWCEMPLFNSDGDILHGIPVLNPVLRMVQYAYPVHLISPRMRPETPASQAYIYLIYRDAAQQVKFMQINAATQQLVQLLQPQTASGWSVLAQLASCFPQFSPEQVEQFAGQTIAMLKDEGVILGTLSRDSGSSASGT